MSSPLKTACIRPVRKYCIFLPTSHLPGRDNVPISSACPAFIREQRCAHISLGRALMLPKREALPRASHCTGALPCGVTIGQCSVAPQQRSLRLSGGRCDAMGILPRLGARDLGEWCGILAMTGVCNADAVDNGLEVLVAVHTLYEA
ncbi:hypothetical protein Efla_007109 [Eimeria flavescens]